MVKIDDDTQKALLLFNRRTEAAEAVKAAERNLAKAVKAKDEAAAALKRAQDSGGGAESVAEAEAEWRTAVDAWQRARDGEEPEEASAEDTADEPPDADEDTPAEDTADETPDADEDTPAEDTADTPTSDEKE